MKKRGIGIVTLIIGILLMLFTSPKLTGFVTFESEEQEMAVRVIALIIFIGGVLLAVVKTKEGPIIRSSIKGHKGLERMAQEAGEDESAQRDINHLINDGLYRGEEKVGLGTKRLSNTISYLRGRNGGRVFYRQIKDKYGEIVGYDIVGKSSKKNEENVIAQLRDIYGD